MAAPGKPDQFDGRDRRRWTRYDVKGEVRAELVTEDGPIVCHIENVSLAGAKVRLAAGAGPKGRLRLDCLAQNGPSGRCAWSEAGSLGLKLDYTEESVDMALACIRHRLVPAAKPEESA